MPEKSLKEKLGWKAGTRTLLLGLPAGMASPFAGEEHRLSPEAGARYDLLLGFAVDRAAVAALAPLLLAGVDGDAAKVWVCYPKGSSGIQTDLNRDAGWEPMFQAGWIVVAIAAVDATWSAVRFRPKHLVKSVRGGNLRSSVPGGED